MSQTLLDSVKEVCCQTLGLGDYQDSKVRVVDNLVGHIVHGDRDGLGVVGRNVNKDTVRGDALFVLHRRVEPGWFSALNNINQI